MARNGSPGGASRAAARIDLATSGFATADAARWFDLDPTPVFVLRLDGALLNLNESGRHLLEAGTAMAFRGGQLAFSDDEAQTCFTMGLEKMSAGAGTMVPVVLRCDDGRWRRLDLLRDGRGSEDRVFVALRGEPKRDVDIEPLAEAFRLSVAEGKVLRHVAEGLAPKSIAARLKVSPHTVRAHMRSLYVKMHVRGMQELIREYTRLVA
jgi:DNA-binding CsgD family transcriptional regulator